MTSPLTPRQGFTVTIGQFLHKKPVASIECRTCHWRQSFDVPLDGDPAALGVAVWEQVGAYTDHTCGHVGTDMQDSPAVLSAADAVTLQAQAFDREGKHGMARLLFIEADRMRAGS